jgi:hypothetical protein
MNSSTGIISYNNKYSFWHPVYKSSNISLFNGLKYGGIGGSSHSGIGISTIGKSYGRWYWEIKPSTSGIGTHSFIGITTVVPSASNINYLGHVNNSVGFQEFIVIGASSFYYNTSMINGSYTYSRTGTFSTGEIVGLGLELNVNTFNLKFYKNNIVYNTISITQGTWYAANAPKGANDNTANFGATGFSYPVPAGYSSGLFNPIYSRLDPSYTQFGLLTNNNLTFNSNSIYNAHSMGQVGKSSGKWYWEVTPTVGTYSFAIGIASHEHVGYVGSSTQSWCWIIYSGGANTIRMNWPSYSSYGVTYGIGDYIGVALDMDGGNITMYKNGVSQGLMFSGLTGTMYPIVSGYMSPAYGTTPVYNLNFGATAFRYPAPANYIYGLYI